jgi:putative aldouronate transport system substrate-binding protein
MKSNKRGRQMSAYIVVGLAALLVAACSNTASTKQGEEGAKAIPKLTALTYWVPLPAANASIMKSFSDVAAYQELEKKTGVKVEFQHPPQGQEKDQFNLMITSGKLPDVIEYNWRNYSGGPEKAITDGKVIKLNDYMDKYAPNLKKVLQDHPEWKKELVTDDGSIIGFPFIRGDKYLLTSNGLSLRKDWLDKTGLSMPTTIDQWYTVLKAFKEKDPNGNGKQDEIPLQLTLANLTSSHAFVGAWGITAGFYNDNGKVKYGPLDPKFKEFLMTMNKWYKEGLIEKDFTAIDAKLLDAKITGNIYGAAIIPVGGGVGRYLNLMADKDPKFTLEGAPYPVLKAGDKPELGNLSPAWTGTAAAITSSNKNIEESIKWLDYKYSPEGGLLFNFGVEGVSYKMENGSPKYTDLVLHNPEGLPVQQALVKNSFGAIEGPYLQDKRYMEQYAGLPQQSNALKVWMEPANKKVMPPVFPSSQDSSKYSSIMNDVNTYLEENFNKFVMGVQPLDQFDKFTSTLKSMGVEEAIRIQQDALERFNKR